MRVTAVVVTWDSVADVVDCLASIDAQDHGDLGIVVVDNASTDGTLAAVEDWARSARHSVRTLANRRNRGFAGGVNDALAADDAEAVLLVNPDARLAPDLVSRCVAVLDRRPRCGSVQPHLVRPGTPVLVDTTGHVLTRPRLVRNRDEGRVDGPPRPAGPVFGVSGAVALHRRAMLDDIAWTRPDGGSEHLTEDLVAYFDDVELDYRARSRGWEAWYEPSARATHARGGVRRSRSTWVEALSLANRLLVVLGMEDPRTLVRAAPALAATTSLAVIELLVTRPAALVLVLRRLRLLGRARARGRVARARAIVPMREVVATWVVPLDVGDWVRTWWRRVRAG